jgi:hypothetical protein
LPATISECQLNVFAAALLQPLIKTSGVADVNCAGNIW